MRRWEYQNEWGTIWKSERYAPVAVVGCAPDGDDRPVEHELVALHRELVRAGYEVNSVPMREDFRDVCAEEVAGPTRRETPPVDVCTEHSHER